MKTLMEVSDTIFIECLAKKASQFSGYNYNWEIEKGMLSFENANDFRARVVLSVNSLRSGIKILHEVYGRMKHLEGLSVEEQRRIISILS